MSVASQAMQQQQQQQQGVTVEAEILTSPEAESPMDSSSPGQTFRAGLDQSSQTQSSKTSSARAHPSASALFQQSELASVDAEPDQARSGYAEEQQMQSAADDVINPEELQAARHAQAMAPGIDALRKRRKQSEPKSAPAEAADSMPAINQQQVTSPSTEVFEQATEQQNLEMSAAQDIIEISDAALTADINSPTQDMAQLAESESLLDAIIAGSIDWEELASLSASAQEIAGSQQSAQEASQPRTSDSQLIAPQTSTAHVTQQQTKARSPQSQSMHNQQADHPPQTLSQLSHEPDESESSSVESKGTETSQVALDQQQNRQAQEPISLPQLSQSQAAQTQAKQQGSGEAGRGASDSTTKASARAARSSSGLRLHRNAPGLQTKTRRMREAAMQRAQSERLQAAKLQPATTDSSSDQAGTLFGSQAVPQQDKWRVVKSESTFAEEFVKPTSDVAEQRPVWAVRAGLPSSAPAGSSGGQVDGIDTSSAESATAVESSESRALTKKELKALADRRGLDFERLLLDARSRGILVTD